ncbi:MAG: hypothetical protein MK193_11425, partial [Lentisphaeria bacterium]|nr:hypothetical protein [Lentisphaeria bacterium]
PAAWHELGGGVQSIIVDGDAYEDSQIYWNSFQIINPSGHRGIKTISPDRSWLEKTGKASSPHWISNFTIAGNSFLSRWDHNNHPLNGYFRPASDIAGAYNIPHYELLAYGNLRGALYAPTSSRYFQMAAEGRPAAEVGTSWRSVIPRLEEIYARPITYTGTKATGYHPNFDTTTYAQHKLLKGWVSPTDYAPEGKARDKNYSQHLAKVSLAPKGELEKIAPMPLNTAEFLGDPLITEGFYEEHIMEPVKAQPISMEKPWTKDSKDTGFILHIAFDDIGTPGTRRSLVKETDGTTSYEVALTERDTVEFLLTKDTQVLSQVESYDTFAKGDHLTMQVDTTYRQLFVESDYVYSQLKILNRKGITRVVYHIQDSQPKIETNYSELHVWLNKKDKHRFYTLSHKNPGIWETQYTGLDTLHDGFLRSQSTYDKTKDETKGTFENYWRENFPVKTGTYYLYLQGPGMTQPNAVKEGDYVWLWDGTNRSSMRTFTNGKLAGNRYFNHAATVSGRPMCMIRKNINSQNKYPTWKWTPHVKLPRGKVELFSSFTGSYGSLRIIRGGQGSYGEPVFTKKSSFGPAYRTLESESSALVFIRKPLDEKGRVPGWGTPDIYLHK